VQLQRAVSIAARIHNRRITGDIIVIARLVDIRRAVVTFALTLSLVSVAHGQFSGNPAARPLVTGAVVATNLARLAGNVRPEINTANDLGQVPANFPIEHMFVQLQRPAVEEAALRQLIDQLHDPNSPNFHQWLTPSEFGARFGPAESDVQQITNWLQGQGFQVNVVYPSGMTIDFSGTAGQVAAAFHTEIHSFAAGHYALRKRDGPTNPGGAGARRCRHCRPEQLPAAPSV
jgi:hypothetical protein